MPSGIENRPVTKPAMTSRGLGRPTPTTAVDTLHAAMLTVNNTATPALPPGDTCASRWDPAGFLTCCSRLSAPTDGSGCGPMCSPAWPPVGGDPAGDGLDHREHQRSHADRNQGRGWPHRCGCTT